MNDERFFDLAMKVIARQATDAERAELDALLAREPGWMVEFKRLQSDNELIKEALPLIQAMKSTLGEFPTYARGRLQTKVRQPLGRPTTTGEVKGEREPSMEFDSMEFGAPRRGEAQSAALRRRRHPTQLTGTVWRWLLGFAAVTAVILVVALPMFRTPSTPAIQLAILDTAGATRGPDTNDAASFQKTWPTATLEWFSSVVVFRDWESQDKANTVKIVYDRAAAEVRVFGKWRGKSFEKTFVIEQDLATTLTQAKAFIGEQTKD